MRIRALLWTLAAVDLVLIALVFCFTPAASTIGIPWVGYDSDTWHAFVLPHLVLTAALVLAVGWSLRGFGVRAGRTIILISLGWAQPLLAGTYLWAIHQWPGGDDGGGMSWLLIVGPVTAATLMAAAIATARRADDEPRVAAIARMVYSFSIAGGFGVWALLPWLDIALAP